MPQWQWWDDTRWTDYAKATCDLLDAQPASFRVDVDGERFVESADLAAIRRTFAGLPDDIAGLCAFQRRKDNPHRVRLVRKVLDAPVFADRIAVADYTFATDVARQHIDLLAAVNGARLVKPAAAQVVVMDFQQALLDVTRKTVKTCIAHATPIVRSAWVVDSVAKNQRLDTAAYDITAEYTDLLNHGTAVFSTKKNKPQAVPVFLGPPQAFSEGSEDDSGDDSQSEDYTGSDEASFEGPPAVAAPPQPVAPPLVSIKNATFEGELIYTVTHEKYDFQIHFIDDVDVKGVLTWTSLNNSQTRFVGTRDGASIALRETEIIRGADMVEMSEYTLTVVSKNSLKGTLKEDQTVQLHAERIQPSKRVPVLSLSPRRFVFALRALSRPNATR